MPRSIWVKAQLVFEIDGIRKKRGLKQIQMAEMLGIREFDVSKMLRGEFRQFSMERLLRYVVALDQDSAPGFAKPLTRRSE